MTEHHIDISGDWRPQARPDLQVVEMDGETVIVLGPALHHLDAVGTLVWSLLDGDATVDEIVADIAATFQVPERDVRGDIETFLIQLLVGGLVANPDDAEARTAGRKDQGPVEPPESGLDG